MSQEGREQNLPRLVREADYVIQILASLVYSLCETLCGLRHMRNCGYAMLRQLIHLKFIMLSDSQVFIALFVSLITGLLAVRLGTQLYK